MPVDIVELSTNEPDVARRDLQAADPTTGATAVKWGFGPSARVTSCYRQQYGVLPSHTLRT